MTIEEMIRRKKEFGYSCQDIATLSAVPVSTVQKVLSSTTTSPHYRTLTLLSIAFEDIAKHNNSIKAAIAAQEAARAKYLDPQLDAKCAYITNHEETGCSAVHERCPYGVSGTSALKSTACGDKTIADYYALPDEQRAELIDGVIYDMSAPTYIHQIIGGEIYRQLKNYISANNGSCIPLISPADVQLDCDDKTMVQPDVFVFCDRKKIIKKRGIGAPDLVIEILSESNWFHDVVRKFEKYRNAGVREYWIVMPDTLQVCVYFFEKSADSIKYTFTDSVPVNIWDGKCEIDFKAVYDSFSFLLE